MDSLSDIGVFEGAGPRIDFPCCRRVSRQSYLNLYTYTLIVRDTYADDHAHEYSFGHRDCIRHTIPFLISTINHDSDGKCHCHANLDAYSNPQSYTNEDA